MKYIFFILALVPAWAGFHQNNYSMAETQCLTKAVKLFQSFRKSNPLPSRNSKGLISDTLIKVKITDEFQIKNTQEIDGFIRLITHYHRLLKQKKNHGHSFKSINLVEKSIRNSNSESETILLKHFHCMVKANKVKIVFF